MSFLKGIRLIFRWFLENQADTTISRCPPEMGHLDDYGASQLARMQKQRSTDNRRTMAVADCQ